MGKIIGDICNGDSDNVTEKAIRAAYWYGQAVAAKRLGLKYQQALINARIKAKSLRYHHQAESVLSIIDNGQGYIYDGSFGDDEIGGWDFELPSESVNI